MNTIKKIYEQTVLSGFSFTSPSETEHKWASFGKEIYNEFLKDEDEINEKLKEIGMDFNIIMGVISKDEKKRLSKVLGNIFNKYNKGKIL